MAATGAERARRHRRHRKGDHSLCDPSRCDGTEGVTAPVARSAGPGARGRRLWRELGGADLTGDRRVLAEEACRIVDRLDRLDALLSGTSDAWLRWMVNEDGTQVTVVVDKALSEARQQAVALKQIVAELRQGAAPARRPPATGSGTGSGVADLTAKIAEKRRAQTAG